MFYIEQAYRTPVSMPVHIETCMYVVRNKAILRPVYTIRFSFIWLTNVMCGRRYESTLHAHVKLINNSWISESRLFSVLATWRYWIPEEVSLQFRLDQISSLRSLTQSSVSPQTGSEFTDLKSGPIPIVGLGIYFLIDDTYQYLVPRVLFPLLVRSWSGGLGTRLSRSIPSRS